MTTTTDRQATDLEQFRARLRETLQRISPPPGPHEHLQKTDHRAVEEAKRYQAALADAGFAGLTWPPELGGQGLGIEYQTILNEEQAVTPPPPAWWFTYSTGFGMCLPTILAHGTEAIQRRYLPPAIRGEEIWCQLFSEPGAGSDVAGLSTRARRDGDTWYLTGQKVWTSGAQNSDFGIILARTNVDVPKHRGLTMFIIDLHAPGVSIRPLRQMDGEQSFNEIFLDEVPIPHDHLLGGEGEGWNVAITTLMNERVWIGAGDSVTALTARDLIPDHLELVERNGLGGDPRIRQLVADLYIRHAVLSLVGLRVRAVAASGRQPGPEGSIAKLAKAQLAAFDADVALALAGTPGLAWPGGDADGDQWSRRVVSAPGSSIAGGTREIMRNILGERVLGLPREPAVDRDIPFRDVLRSGPGRRAQPDPTEG